MSRASSRLTAVRTWLGTSACGTAIRAGRWEGNTLVVEVTNYRQSRVGTISTSIATAPTLMGLPQSDAMRVVERFTRLDANTLQYEATIEDPGVYGHPWTVSMPLMKDDEYQMYEYACHEGNYGLPNALSGGTRQGASHDQAVTVTPHNHTEEATCGSWVS